MDGHRVQQPDRVVWVLNSARIGGQADTHLSVDRRVPFTHPLSPVVVVSPTPSAQVSVTVRTGGLSAEQRALVPLVLSLLFESPVRRASSGEVTGHTEMVRLIADATLSTGASLGFGGGRFGPGAFGELACVTARAAADRYAEVVALLADCVFGGVVVAERVKVQVAKALAAVPQYRRDGGSNASAVLRSMAFAPDSNKGLVSFVRQGRVLQRLLARLESDPQVAVAEVEAVRAALFGCPQRVCVHAASRLAQLRQPTVTAPWESVFVPAMRAFAAAAASGAAPPPPPLGAVRCMCASEQLSGRAAQGCVVGNSAVESGAGGHSVRCMSARVRVHPRTGTHKHSMCGGRALASHPWTVACFAPLPRLSHRVHGAVRARGVRGLRGPAPGTPDGRSGVPDGTRGALLEAGARARSDFPAVSGPTVLRRRNGSITADCPVFLRRADPGAGPRLQLLHQRVAGGRACHFYSLQSRARVQGVRRVARHRAGIRRRDQQGARRAGRLRRFSRQCPSAHRALCPNRPAQMDETTLETAISSTVFAIVNRRASARSLTVSPARARGSVKPGWQLLWRIGCWVCAGWAVARFRWVQVVSGCFGLVQVGSRLVQVCFRSASGRFRLVEVCFRLK